MPDQADAKVTNGSPMSSPSDSPVSRPIEKPSQSTLPQLSDDPPSGSPITPGRARSFSAASVGFYTRTVVLALDASDHAQYAFDWFLNNIHRPDDLMILVHCPETPHLPSFSFKSPMAPPIHEWKDILDDLNTRTRHLEENYEGTCIQKKLKYKVRGEAMKNPGEGILKIADEEKAALVCMGSQGLGTLKRAFLGSVSDYVIRNSTVPVIVVPSKKK